jgi:hypothetical protein
MRKNGEKQITSCADAGHTIVPLFTMCQRVYCADIEAVKSAILGKTALRGLVNDGPVTLWVNTALRPG